MLFGQVVAFVGDQLRGVGVQIDQDGALQQALDTRRVGLGLSCRD